MNRAFSKINNNKIDHNNNVVIDHNNAIINASKTINKNDNTFFSSFNFDFNFNFEFNSKFKSKQNSNSKLDENSKLDKNSKFDENSSFDTNSNSNSNSSSNSNFDSNLDLDLNEKKRRFESNITSDQNQKSNNSNSSIVFITRVFWVKIFSNESNEKFFVKYSISKTFDFYDDSFCIFKKTKTINVQLKSSQIISTRKIIKTRNLKNSTI